MKNLLFLNLILVITVCNSYAQTEKLTEEKKWQKMMLDPGASFFEIQEAFYDYWKDKTPGKGQGYSVFKRWEYFWEGRVDSAGNFPEPARMVTEYEQFILESRGRSDLKTGQPQWVELGPRNRAIWKPEWGIEGLGRINAIAFHPVEENIIYVGAPNGGLWITKDGGENWATHTDDLPAMGVSAILVKRDEPNKILIGTGDRDGGDSWQRGAMISLDGGITWEPANEGLGDFTVGDLEPHETDPNTILAATNRGLYKTSNFGSSWTMVLSNDEVFYEVKYKPGDMNTAFAGSAEGYYRSDDGGESWTRLGEDAGISKSGRTSIGVSQTDPDRVYLLVGSDKMEGFFISTDGGQTFNLEPDVPNVMGSSPDGSDDIGQSWYDIYVFVDPGNAEIIYTGGINTWKSSDGGKTWEITSHWTGDGAPFVHADHHCVEYNPLNGRIYDGNDGGVYWTDDRGETWNNISFGLGIGQLYKVGVSAGDKNMTAAGFQDNGSAVLTDQGWITVSGGDGIECVIDPEKSEYLYTTMQNGQFLARIRNFTDVLIIGGEEGIGMSETGGWIIPYGLSEWDSNTMVAGWKNLYITRRARASSNNFKWEKITNFQDSTDTRVMEFSPADSNLLYYTRLNDSRLYVTENLLDNPFWIDLSGQLPNTNWIFDLEAHPYKRETIYMGQGTYAYKSEDLGKTWKNITGNLPWSWIRDLAFDKSSENGLYAATDLGVYYSTDDGENWILYGEGLPASVQVSELEIYYDRVDRAKSRLRASTFGRGLWEVPLAANEKEQLLPPMFLTASEFQNDVELSWHPPYYPRRVLSYNVHRNGEIIGSASGPFFLDRDATDNSSAIYHISANYSEGVSVLSNEAIAFSAIPFPYEQDFEDNEGGLRATYNDLGWMYGKAETLSINGNDDHFYGINSAKAGENKHVNDILYIPQIDLDGMQGKTITLGFDYALRVYRNYDKLSIVYRLSKSGPWTTLESLPSTGKTDWIWERHSIDLPEELLVDGLQIGFSYTDSKELGWGAGIDNIRLNYNTTGVDQYLITPEMYVFPNPNDGSFEIKLRLTNQETVQISLHDISGKKIIDEAVIPEGLELSHRVNIKNYPAGQYYLKVSNSNIDLNQIIIIN